ncbi:MAG: hypothetical protein FJX57_18105, partial [Alphaproteobacteria bacterium]|nr:hypothetical protein [Alphaproteobacteria bacterium]
TGVDFSAIFRDCMKALHDDPDTALLVQFADIGSDSYIHAGYFEAHKAIIGQTTKPMAVATNYTQVQHDALVGKFEQIGVPVIDGTAAALTAIRNMLAHRDFQARGIANLEPPPVGIRTRWAARLAEPRPLAEAEGLQLFAGYGIATIPFRIAESADAAVAAATALGFPVALKTAADGVLHKTDSDGVRLGLNGASEVRTAYEDVAARLGARVLLAPMAAPGVDVMLGMTLDPQFGPVVVIGAGGILVEALNAVTHELAPFDPSTARRAVERLAPLKRLLAGVRGRPASDLDSLCGQIARFSVMCADLAPLVAEIDANPVIAGAGGAIVVDAAVVPRAAVGPRQRSLEPWTSRSPRPTWS